MAQLATNNAQSTDQQDGKLPNLPKPQEKIDPALQKQYDEMEKKLDATAKENLGTSKDEALKYVRDKLEDAAKRHAPTLREAMDQLTKDLKADGRFDANDIMKLQQFQQDFQNGKVQPPAALLEIGKGLELAEQVMKDGSVARTAMLQLDRRLITEHPEKIMQAFYRSALSALHEFEEQAAAKK